MTTTMKCMWVSVSECMYVFVYVCVLISFCVYHDYLFLFHSLFFSFSFLFLFFFFSRSAQKRQHRGEEKAQSKKKMAMDRCHLITLTLCLALSIAHSLTWILFYLCSNTACLPPTLGDLHYGILAHSLARSHSITSHKSKLIYPNVNLSYFSLLGSIMPRRLLGQHLLMSVFVSSHLPLSLPPFLSSLVLNTNLISLNVSLFLHISSSCR